MKQFIPLAFLVGLAALVVVAIRNGPEVRSAQLGVSAIGPNFLTLQSPDKVTAYRLTAATADQEPSDDQPIFRSQRLALRMVGDPIAPEENWDHELVAEVTNSRSLNPALPTCLPNPGVAVEFAKGPDRVTVYFCFECDLMGIGDGNTYKWTSFGANRRALALLMKRLYPVDAAIQSLNEVDDLP